MSTVRHLPAEAAMRPTSIATFSVRHARPALALLLAISLGCSSGPSVFGVEVMRQRWERAEPASYRYELQRHCFCPPEMLAPVTIEVSGGTVLRRYFSGSGTDVPAEFLAQFPAIEGLFDRVEEVARRDPVQFDVEYDDEYGFPVRAVFDLDARIADDESFFLVRDFQPFL